MGTHKPDQVAIGAFVNIELRDYLDQLVIERGLSTRSDALRAIIHEHMALFSKKIDRNLALTPLEPVANEEYSNRAIEMNSRPLLDLFEWFRSMLDNIIDSNTIPPLTNLNKTYGLNLSLEIFQQICSEHKKGNLTIEDFKKLRRREVS